MEDSPNGQRTAATDDCTGRSERGYCKKTRLPRTVLVGSDALNSVGATCRELFPKGTVIVICDPITRDIAGDRVVAQLEAAGFSPAYHLIEDASIEEVDIVLNRFCSIGSNGADGAKKGSKGADDAVQFFAGVGGGRPVDVAKCASHKAGKYFVSVPTAASHDGIASAAASLTVQGKKQSISAEPPLAVIADTTVIKGSPYRLIASGCADIISNHTAVEDWRRARDMTGEYYSVYAAELALMTARILEEQAADIPAMTDRSVRTVINALVSSGVAMSIAGSSRPASGAEHLFSHALDRMAARPALHGEQCGIGSIMTGYLQNGDWEQIRTSLEIIGAPVTAQAAGLTREEIIEALVMAVSIRPDRHTILGGGINAAQAEELAEATGVL